MHTSKGLSRKERNLMERVTYRTCRRVTRSIFRLFGRTEVVKDIEGVQDHLRHGTYK